MSDSPRDHTPPVSPPHILRLSNYIYYLAPLLYISALVLSNLLPRVDVWGSYLLVITLPAMVLASTVAVCIRIILPPRTWPLSVAFILNLTATTFLGLMLWTAITFPGQD